jgi:hypothetical protein
MRFAAFPLLLLALSLARGETHMRILQEKKLLGYATVSQRLTSDGGKQVELRMEFQEAGMPKALLHKTSTYDKLGRPTRMVLEMTGPAHVESIATFDSEGATCTRMAHGVAKGSKIPRASTAPWSNVSEFWFLRDKPKEGQTVQTLLFSIDHNEWELTQIRYLGRREIKVSGKTVQANAIESTANGRTTTAYVSDAGDPIVLELGEEFRMEEIVK